MGTSKLKLDMKSCENNVESNNEKMGSTFIQMREDKMHYERMQSDLVNQMADFKCEVQSDLKEQARKSAILEERLLRAEKELNQLKEFGFNLEKRIVLLQGNMIRTD